VAEADDADGAVVSAEEVPPDLAVVEWAVAGGPEICEALKQASPRVHVVAVVDRADSADRRALLEQGADEVLTRPVSPIRLLATARMLLGGEVFVA
jgi:DNA-binding response OmpR family regulator